MLRSKIWDNLILITSWMEVAIEMSLSCLIFKNRGNLKESPDDSWISPFPI